MQPERELPQEHDNLQDMQRQIQENQNDTEDHQNDFEELPQEEQYGIRQDPQDNDSDESYENLSGLGLNEYPEGSDEHLNELEDFEVVQNDLPESDWDSQNPEQTSQNQNISLDEQEEIIQTDEAMSRETDYTYPGEYDAMLLNQTNISGSMSLPGNVDKDSEDDELMTRLLREEEGAVAMLEVSVNDELMTRLLHEEEGAVALMEDTTGDEKLARELAAAEVEGLVEERQQRARDEQMAKELAAADQQNLSEEEDTTEGDEEMARDLAAAEQVQVAMETEADQQRRLEEEKMAIHSANLFNMFPDADPDYLEER